MAKCSDEQYIEKLVDAETYQVWKFEITILLKAKGLYSTVMCNPDEKSKKMTRGIQKTLKHNR